MRIAKKVEDADDCEGEIEIKVAINTEVTGFIKPDYCNFFESICLVQFIATPML